MKPTMALLFSSCAWFLLTSFIDIVQCESSPCEFIDLGLDSKRTWDSASHECQNRNLTLITIPNDRKLKVFLEWASTKKFDDQIWIGLHTSQRDNYAEWEWVTGEQFDYDGMNAIGRGNCVFMNARGFNEGKWMNGGCTHGTYYVICERPSQACMDSIQVPVVTALLSLVDWIAVVTAVVVVLLIVIIVSFYCRRRYTSSRLRRVLYIDKVTSLYERTSSYMVCYFTEMIEALSVWL